MRDLQKHVTNDLEEYVQKFFLSRKSDDFTYISGLVGGKEPSTYAASPRLWNTAYKNLSIDAVFVAFDVRPEEKRNNFCKFIDDLGNKPNFRVLWVTDPYKKDMFNYLQQKNLKLDQIAQRVGAVNTLLKSENELIGYNTDGLGMVRNLSKVTDLKGKRILQIGAGGAGTAVAHEVTRRLDGGSFYILNRTVIKAKRIAEALEKADYNVEEIKWLGAKLDNVTKAELDESVKLNRGELEQILDKYGPNVDIIINMTTLSNPIPFKIARNIPSEVLFVDAKYAPEQIAPFKEVAGKTNHQFVNGLGMLFWQFIEAFQMAYSEELGDLSFGEDKATLNKCAQAIGYDITKS